MKRDSLTVKEHTALNLKRAGKITDPIAEILHLSAETVRKYLPSAPRIECQKIG